MQKEDATEDAPAELLAVSLCALLGTTVSGAVGFGGAVTFLAFAAAANAFVDMPLRRSIMLSIFRSALTNPVMIYLSRRHIPWRVLRLLTPGLLLGAPIGQFLLYVMSAAALQSVLGAVCLVVVIERLATIGADAHAQQPTMYAAQPAELTPSSCDAAGSAVARPVVEPLSRRASIAAVVTGSVSGVLGSSLGTSGLPVILYAAYHPMHKTALRSLVCAVGVPTQSFALCVFLWLGVLQVSTRQHPCPCPRSF